MEIVRVGQDYIITGIYGAFGREITKCTVLYGVYILFRPRLESVPALLSVFPEA